MPQDARTVHGSAAAGAQRRITHPVAAGRDPLDPRQSVGDRDDHRVVAVGEDRREELVLKDT
ncbi:MAG TPA: hypothetical protein VGD12_02665, partial [Blastococcus sp.]